MVVQTILFIFGTVLLFNSIFTYILWRKNKELILKHLLCFWLTGLVSFFLQGIFNNLFASGFLAFSINGISAYFLVSILYQTTTLQTPKKFIALTVSSGILLSLVLNLMDVRFYFSIAPFIFSIAMVLLRAGYEVLKNKPDSLQKGYALLLVLTTLHFLDYPVLRPIENLAVVGFSISLMIFFSYSIYIPLFITQKLSERYTNNLENEVEIRTHKLSLLSEELRQANQDLEAHNKLLNGLARENESLIHILVHDISNPVQVISLTNNKLKKSLVLEADRAKAYRNIGVALEGIGSIIRTVRSLQAIKSGKQELTLSNENLNSLIKGLLQSFETQLGEKKLSVDFSGPSQDLLVKTNVDILKHQILGNLLSNSIKFSPTNSKIRLKIEDFEDFIGVSIRDYGIGIPSSLKKDIFSLSVRTSRLGTNGETGTGFGLPLAKKYAQLIKADIELAEINDSMPGTCFMVKFNKVS